MITSQDLWKLITRSPIKWQIKMVIKDCYHAFNLPLGEIDNSMKTATTNIQYSM